MNYKISKIHLSVEKLGQEDIDYTKEKTDVIVELESGETFAAAFFTYDKLDEIIHDNKINGDYLNGKFFWAEGMLLIENCSMEHVEEVVLYLIDEGDFDSVFQKLQ